MVGTTLVLLGLGTAGNGWGAQGGLYGCGLGRAEPVVPAAGCPPTGVPAARVVLPVVPADGGTVRVGALPVVPAVGAGAERVAAAPVSLAEGRAARASNP